MVDTAVFSIFHRQRPPPQPAAPEPSQTESNVHDQPTAAAWIDGQSASIEPEPTPIAAQPAPHIADVSAVPSTIAWLDLPVGHEFIGLANPAVWAVKASFSPAEPFTITAESTGLYRPPDFRPAPWSGFAYDVAPDRRTGLVAGTQILTARGEIAVEDLLPGDTAMALRGPALLPIVWIGRCMALEPPVVIEAGALGNRRPSRSLVVAADHPIFVDPIPVPAKRLVNGTTIRSTGIDSAELFHVDVGQQEVLFAQNVPLASTQRPVEGVGG